eukprot:m51a1_g3545 hypothetical protein (346) ;mRNA; r:990658-992110
MTSERADEVARMCGMSLKEWFLRAESIDFYPVQLCSCASLRSTYRFQYFNGTSVVGVVRGTKSPHEAVVLSAHIDHLGVRPLDGAVFAGSLDNGSGAAVVLAQALAMAQAQAAPARSVVFLWPTAEEAGLLGSAYFVRHPPSALAGVKVLADINYDIVNAWGPSEDIGVIGRDLSTLGTEVVAWAAQGEGMVAAADPTPKAAGFLYRGDQYSFLKAGVPAVWMFTGARFTGRDAGYFEKAVWQGYFCTCYHNPCDASAEDADLRGMVQQARVGILPAQVLLLLQMQETQQHINQTLQDINQTVHQLQLTQIHIGETQQHIHHTQLMMHQAQQELLQQIQQHHHHG